jgi:hypothetical protein
MNKTIEINEAALEDLVAKIECEEYYAVAKSVCDAIGPRARNSMRILISSCRGRMMLVLALGIEKLNDEEG